MRRRLLLVAMALLVGAGGTACNEHSAEGTNPNHRQPGGACHGPKCHPNPGPTPPSQGGGGDGDVDQ